MSHDESSIADSSDYGTLAPSDAQMRLVTALDLLRREWRGGFSAGMAYYTTLGSVRRLQRFAASEQVAAELATVIADLEAYAGLPIELRPEALTAIADAINRLIAQIATPSRPVQPIETLENELMLVAVQENRPTQNLLSGPSASPAAVIAALHRLSPSDFERVVASLLQAQGCNNVQVIGGANDRGVDIICNDAHGRLVAVQCKRYKPAQKISAVAIQHLRTMAFVRSASRSIFVTTAGFTDSAWQQAEAFHVESVDGDRLATWLSQHQPIADWVDTYHQSVTGATIAGYSISVDPVMIPHNFHSLYRPADPKRPKVQSLLNRHHPNTPATISNPDRRANVPVEPLPLVTPNQFRQALALRDYFGHLAREYQCISASETDKKRFRRRKEKTFRVYFLDSREGPIRDYAVHYDPDPYQTNKVIGLYRCHYLAPGHVVTAQDLWNFWSQARELGATTTGDYFTNTYFSCGAYSYLLDQPNFLPSVLHMVDGIKLAHWFSRKENDFMSLATCPSLPECFTVGDIQTQQAAAPPTHHPLWRRIFGC